MSDPSGRFPIGLLARQAPDWFSDSLATGGYEFGQGDNTTNAYVQISLFNDATDGSLLRLYGLTAGNDTGFGMVMYPLFGTPNGTFVAKCRSVRFDGGSPPGQIWQQAIPSAFPSPNPDPPPAQSTWLGTPGFDSETWFSPFPIAIIPPGWSLVVANPATTTVVLAAFWYQVAHV
jgi:hypothetical protein